MTESHQTHELLRKSLHIAFGLGAIALRWLPWPIAVAVCVVATIGNWLLLHRIFGKRVARNARGYDAGIVIYPLAVGLLILFFHDNTIVIAAVSWAILAFGDGFATLAGKAIGGPRIPWNRDKSWSGFAAFVVFGYAGANAIYHFFGAGEMWATSPVILGLTVLVAAIGESLPLHIDDNITVPLFASLTMLATMSVFSPPQFDLRPVALWWLVANTALAILGYAAKSVDVSGLIGGWILGAILILLGGWPVYVALLAFFIIGTGATKLGYRKKAKEGLAQEKGGRRGFGHAWANVGVAAILSVILSMMGRWDVLFIAAVASLATAAADTSGSEIGQLIGRRTFLPLTFRSVPRGTEGAISLEGTIASLFGALIVATCAVYAAAYAGEHYLYYRLKDTVTSGDMWTTYPPAMIALITACGFIGAYIESIVGSWNRKQPKPVPNDALNFFNTLVGALLALSVGIATYV